MAPRVRARGRNIEKSLGKVTKEMDSFPVAAVTKYHKLDGLKEHKTVLSGPEAGNLNPQVSAAVPSEGAGGVLLGVWWLQEFLVWWLPHSHLCLHLSQCLYPLIFFLDIGHWI